MEHGTRGSAIQLNAIQCNALFLNNSQLLLQLPPAQNSRAALIQLLLLSTCWGSVTQCSVKSIDAFLMYCSCLHCCCCCCCCCYLLSSAVVATQWTAAAAAPNQLQGQTTFKIKHKKLFAMLIPLEHQFITYHPMPRIKYRGNWQIRYTSAGWIVQCFTIMKITPHH